MRRGAGAVLGTTGAISVLTAMNRFDLLPARTLAGSPQAIADGRIWLLWTSALVADRPAVASIVGLALVGLAAVALCGPRIAWLAAVTGHVGSAALVYAAILLARLVEPTAFHSVFASLDYGTSAIIAAWIGAVAYVLWTHEARISAAALVLVAGLIGWLLKSNLTVLDSEHAIALCGGVLVARHGAPVAGVRSAFGRLLRSFRPRRLAGAQTFGLKSTAITWPFASRSESGPGT